jgi:hypothetical protein
MKADNVKEIERRYHQVMERLKDEKRQLPAQISALAGDLTHVRKTLEDAILRGKDKTEIEDLRGRMETIERELLALRQRHSVLFASPWLETLPEIAGLRAQLDEELQKFAKENSERYQGCLDAIELAKKNYLDSIAEAYRCFRAFYERPIPDFRLDRLKRPRGFQYEISVHDINRHCGREPHPEFQI